MPSYGLGVPACRGRRRPDEGGHEREDEDLVHQADQHLPADGRPGEAAGRADVAVARGRDGDDAEIDRAAEAEPWRARRQVEGVGVAVEDQGVDDRERETGDQIAQGHRAEVEVARAAGVAEDVQADPQAERRAAERGGQAAGQGDRARQVVQLVEAEQQHLGRHDGGVGDPQPVQVGEEGGGSSDRGGHGRGGASAPHPPPMAL